LENNILKRLKIIQHRFIKINKLLKII